MSASHHPSAADSVQTAQFAEFEDPATRSVVRGEHLLETTRVDAAAARVAAGCRRYQGDSDERLGSSFSPVFPHDSNAGLENEDWQAKGIAKLPPNEPKPPTSCIQRPTDGTSELPAAATSTSTARPALCHNSTVEVTDNRHHRDSTGFLGDRSSGGLRQGVEEHAHAVGRISGDFAGEDGTRTSQRFEHFISDSGARGQVNGRSSMSRAQGRCQEVDGLHAAGPARDPRETTSDPGRGRSGASADDGFSGEIGNKVPPGDVVCNLDGTSVDLEPLAPLSGGCRSVDRSVEVRVESHKIPAQTSDDGHLRDCDAEAASRLEANRAGATGVHSTEDKRGHEGNEGEKIGSVDVISFVKDDDVSGSDDEFGKGVAMHMGDQMRRDPRSQREQRDQAPPAVAGGEEDGENPPPPSETILNNLQLGM